MQGFNAFMPVNAFLKCEGQTFRIKSGYLTEAICRSFNAQLRFSVFEKHSANAFLEKSCTLSIEDAHGEGRTWVGECSSFASQTDDGKEWHYTLSFESILSRLKKSRVHFRTEAEVDLKRWVQATFKRHGIQSEQLEWRFPFREVRPRLIQVLQSDYDFILKILAQESIIMWPSADKPTICFANDPAQWHPGALERIFYVSQNDLIQHGGEKLGVFDYQDIHRYAQTPDNEDADKEWEDKSPEKLYSGVPYLLEGMGGPPLNPCKHIDYDRQSIEALFHRRATSEHEKNDTYRYIDASSNALAIAVGNVLSLIDVAKDEETRGRINYVHHELISVGKTLRYRNRFFLQPAMSPWRAVSPLKPILPLVMQAYIDGDDAAPLLNAFGEERVSFPADASDKPVPFEIPRMRTYVNHQGGMSFPLGHRTEVLISFLYGEADLPVIVGALPNLDMPSPVNGANPLDHILSTRSGNKLRFNDEPGSANVSLETSPTHGVWLKNGMGINLRSEGGFVLDVNKRILCQIGKTWNMLAGGSMTYTAGVSQKFATDEGDMILSSSMRVESNIHKSMSLFFKSHMKMKSKQFNMRVNKDMMITVKNGETRYQIKGAVSIQSGDGIKIVGKERIAIQAGDEGSGFIIERGHITLYGKDLIGIETEALALNGNVSYGTAERMSSPIQALVSEVEKAPEKEIKRLVLNKINVDAPTEFYGQKVMPGELDGLLYHIAAEPMTLDDFTHSLYEDPSEEKRANIIQVNPHVVGCIEPGQMVFVADPKSDVYLKFGKALRKCADEIEFFRKLQAPEDASGFAKQFALMGTFGESIGRAPGHYSVLTEPADTVGAGDVAGMITTAGNEYFRQQANTLKRIEDAYAAHPMSKEFIAMRTQALKEMDLKTLELLDTLVTTKNLKVGNVVDASIRMQHGIQEWMPTSKKLIPLSEQYKSAIRAEKALKMGGNLMIGYDAFTTGQRIYDACTEGSDYQCKKVTYKEGGGFLGRTGGGYVAVLITAGIVGLAPLAAGPALIVGVVACGAAGYFGSEAGGKGGEALGTLLFESVRKT